MWRREQISLYKNRKKLRNKIWCGRERRNSKSNNLLQELMTQINSRMLSQNNKWNNKSHDGIYTYFFIHIIFQWIKFFPLKYDHLNLIIVYRFKIFFIYNIIILFSINDSDAEYWQGRWSHWARWRLNISSSEIVAKETLILAKQAFYLQSTYE